AAVDLDKCRDPESGAIAAWAEAIIDRATSAYVEVTVSGTGLRIIGTGTGEAVHRKLPVPGGCEGAAIELYRRAVRYITISGKEIGHCTELPSIDTLIDTLLTENDTAEISRRGHGDGYDHHDHHDHHDRDRDRDHDRVHDDLFGNGIDRIIRDGVPEGQRSQA